jgi:hypothetical protein
LLVFTTGSSVLPFQPPSAQTYICADRSFKLSVPSGYSIHTGKDKPSHSYIPVCHDVSLVCITFPPGQYQGTTFGDASIEVTLLAPKTAEACLNQGTLEVSTYPDAVFQIDSRSPTRVIDGVRFLHASGGGAASSHDIASDRYRGYKNGRCYELALSVTFTNFGVYDPGSIKEFSRQDEKQVTEELRRILDSFRSLR